MRLAIALLACLTGACSSADEAASAHSAYYQCVSSIAHQLGGEGNATPSEANAGVSKCDGKLETAARLRAKQRATIPALRGMTEEQAYKDGVEVFRALALCRLSHEIAIRDCPIA